ncbi:hypothetical protein [Leptospira vanthielii]|uniref:Uncharacterized protein n=1 Tax=Leptospira vanthielii serovar Holland str. Waz Holland = ATCC 700522 TaxID=1218591 RepID=N1WB15_9LEPT|nr:hypothetical protein [Leptospira vanthielii]EMY70610.1 hypothetical protein LEP1GSC199_1629 [Leptospira vanthielii serovar Holland str. Waz Holland = ATCC 700522]
MKLNLKIISLLIVIALNNCVFLPDYSNNFKKYPAKPDRKTISVTKPESRFETFGKNFPYTFVVYQIEENLKFSELFSEVKETEGEYVLTAESIDDKYGDSALDVTYNIKLEYSLHHKNKLIFKNTYEGSGFSKVTEHFMSGFRARLARERALQVTINKLLDDLVVLKIIK